jgi:glycosyltransferase involved in cell wall biosynthesis
VYGTGHSNAALVGAATVAWVLASKCVVITLAQRNNGPSRSIETFCFSHLRWKFVYQRPQHLMTRAAKHGRVHFWEEPIFEAGGPPTLLISEEQPGVRVLTPRLPHGLSPRDVTQSQRALLDTYRARQRNQTFVTWYYTPMALPFSEHLEPACVVYDCMDELSGFQGAPPELAGLEQRMFSLADAVFAGGASLYASKRHWHGNVHLLPSSIDYAHFAAARLSQPDPTDQARIPHPRIGFYGVLDERLDRELLRDMAQAHPELHFVLIGPIVKISEDMLPRSANLHYLGRKEYEELPAYIAHWDVAMLPFAQNASTKFISPTKTPEYLAAGKPVVSSPICDVVTPYADKGLVYIGADAAGFGESILTALTQVGPTWLAEVDRFLKGNSWDKTFQRMWQEVERFTLMPQTTSRVEEQTLGAASNV